MIAIHSGKDSSLRALYHDASSYACTFPLNIVVFDGKLYIFDYVKIHLVRSEHSVIINLDTGRYSWHRPGGDED